MEFALKPIPQVIDSQKRQFEPHLNKLLPISWKALTCHFVMLVFLFAQRDGSVENSIGSDSHFPLRANYWLQITVPVTVSWFARSFSQECKLKC